MQVISFNTKPRFMYNISINKSILLKNNNITLLDKRSKDGELLYYLRNTSYNGLLKYYKIQKFSNKKIVINKKNKKIISKMRSIIKLPNLNRWNELRYQIFKHL
jgi:hypothetical protein